MSLKKLLNSDIFYIEVDKMFFNCDNPVVEVYGVENMSWSAQKFEVAPREYSALAFRIKGSAVISDGEKEYFINTNDILYMPQGMAYTADYTDTEMVVIHFKTLNSDKTPEIYKLNNGEEIYKLFLNANSIWKERAPAYNVYVISLLYRILGKILESYTEKSLPTCFLNAVSYMNANYKSSQLTVGDICKSSGIGETVFRRLFRENYQKTPVEYINELKIEHARNLISSGVNVEVAAYDSGFNDPKYFARVVKKRFGCTPRELKLYGK